MWLFHPEEKEKGGKEKGRTRIEEEKWKKG